MQNVVSVLINGLASGSIYALIVVGMTLLILVRRVVHFGFAYIIIMAAYLNWLIIKQTNNNIFITIPAFIIIGTILVVVTELMFRPMAKKGAFLESMVLGQGLAIFLTDCFSKFFNHGYEVAFPEIAGAGTGIRFGRIFFTLGNIYALAFGIITVVVLLLFLFRTRLGRSIRAMAQNQDIARSFGISFNRTGLIGFGIAGIMAGIVALVIVMTQGGVFPSMGDTLASKAMILLLFAGMGNLTGGLVCALAMGIVEAAAQRYIPGAWTDTIVFSVIMLVILIRPQGVFGERT